MDKKTQLRHSQDHPGGQSRCVKVRASVIGTGTDREIDDFDEHITRKTALKAYTAAGVGPKNIDVAEVHDASAMGEIIQIENLGLCDRGQSGPRAFRGEFSLGGFLPVNPSGGLESKGHPIGATGLAQIHELVTQLRREAGKRQADGARLAIAENSGGLFGVEEAVGVVSILEKS